MEKSESGQMTSRAPQACSGKTILLIDTDVNNHFLHHYYLREYEVNLMHTQSTHHAIWLVQQYKIDLVLTEIWFNGFINYEHLFFILKEKMIPIIVQTSQLSYEYKENCLIRGAEDFFQKPLFWPEYLLMVKKCLEENRN